MAAGFVISGLCLAVEDLLGRLLDQGPEDNADVGGHQMHHPELGYNLQFCKVELTTSRAFKDLRSLG